MGALASEPVAALGVVAPASLQGPQPYRVTRSRCCPRGSKPAHRGHSHLRDGKSAHRSGFSRRICDLLTSFAHNGVLDRRRLHRIGSGFGSR